MKRILLRVLIVPLVFVGVFLFVRSCITYTLLQDEIRTVGWLPPGSYDVDNLGHGWITFKLLVEGKTRSFLMNSNYFTELQQD